jgi:hypothetical protein
MTAVQPMGRKLRTQEDHDRFRLALVAPDEAFFQSETKWGVGRLERLVSLPTLQAYQRGWSAYRVALDDCDGEALEQIGPKMIAMLGIMDAEAAAAGHQPLAPDTWECGMVDGTVLVVVRTNAEASAVIRAERTATAFSASPGAGMRVVTTTIAEPTAETPLPPDLAVTIRQQHEGRRLEVWTMAEIARLIEAHGSLVERTPALGKQWQGNATHSGRQGEEMSAHDQVRTGFPLPAPVAVGLAF